MHLQRAVRFVSFVLNPHNSWRGLVLLLQIVILSAKCFLSLFLRAGVHGFCGGLLSLQRAQPFLAFFNAAFWGCCQIAKCNQPSYAVCCVRRSSAYLGVPISGFPRICRCCITFPFIYLLVFIVLFSIFFFFLLAYVTFFPLPTHKMRVLMYPCSWLYFSLPASKKIKFLATVALFQKCHVLWELLCLRYKDP